ncbi:MAG: LysR family transcriptional regulator [Rhizobiales bacterium]|nr:LysR family transcriptional regulator [Hyphomicrobiales bacterium]NRB13265.1 LysR family transcriptional regulator [Hyphomicrobiales bacterium]
MDRRSIKFDWNHARAFLVTAEEGSLSAAARLLGVAQPTLGRQVSALEAQLGVVLFERVGRGLTLTPTGQDLLSSVRDMGDAATQMSLKSTGRSDSIQGTVLIAASEVYAAFSLPAIIAKLRILQPDIHIEVITSNSSSDLLRREADIAIRNFRPTEPDLIAKKIKDIPARLYATPEYIKKLGKLNSPDDLTEAEFIGIDHEGTLMHGLNKSGFKLTDNNFPIIAENWLVMWEFVKNGLGIGILDSNFGDLEPKVARVLPNLKPLTASVWLVAHRELNSSARIRIVYDLLAQELAK